MPKGRGLRSLLFMYVGLSRSPLAGQVSSSAIRFQTSGIHAHFGSKYMPGNWLQRHFFLFESSIMVT